MKAKNINFQGDLGFAKLPDNFNLPEGFVESTPEAKGLILAYGEVSGHTHRVEDTDSATVFFNPSGTKHNVGYDEMYIFCKKPCLLVHEEHDPILLSAGWHLKFNQKEYTFEDEYRVVAD